MRGLTAQAGGWRLPNGGVVGALCGRPAGVKPLVRQLHVRAHRRTRGTGIVCGQRVENGHIVMPDIPGIGFEGKADLIKVMRELAE